MGMVKDTELEQVGPELPAIMEEVSAMLDNTKVVMMLVDSDRRVRRLNRAALDFGERLMEDVIGLRKGDALGCLHALDDPEGCGFGPSCHECAIRCAVLDTLDTKKYRNGVEAKLTFMRGKDERTIDFILSTAPVESRDGTKVLVCLEDVTERKQLEEKLGRSQRLEVLGQLVSGVAHEVRNPLNAILAISGALRQGLGDNAEYVEYIDQIHTQVDRLAALMQDLLDLGKPIRKADLRLESLPRVCAGAVDLWKQTASCLHHEVRIVKPPPNDSMSVLCDSAKLQQVFLNLFENAAQHSPEGDEIRLEISGPDNGMMTVRVIDRGHGVPPEKMDLVFQPFFTTHKKGTGLGLSIVRHIVEIHDGKVTMRNNDPPPGCTVEISLPQRSEK